MIVNLFAGAGGWEVPLVARDVPTLGVEINRDVHETRAAAKLRTILGDVSAVDAARIRDREHPFGLIASPPCQDWSTLGRRAGLDSVRGSLVYEAWRWSYVLEPAFVVAEQVPPALPVWRAWAKALREDGLWAWCGILDAADYGTPQHRRRAILIAARWPVGPPAPTHGPRRSSPHVTMAEALGVPASATVNTGRDWKPGKSRDHAQRIPCDRPAPTVDGRGVWRLELNRRWVRNLTPGDMAMLQGFPRSWPWRGGIASQRRQIGDAVPPPLAAAILDPLVARLVPS